MFSGGVISGQEVGDSNPTAPDQAHSRSLMGLHCDCVVYCSTWNSSNLSNDLNTESVSVRFASVGGGAGSDDALSAGPGRAPGSSGRWGRPWEIWE
jgi:hypothetical protein